MTVEISNGRMLITKNGETRLDTNEKFFHITNIFNGSFDIPTVAGAANTYSLTTTTYDIGAVSAGATQVVGAIRFRLNNNAAGMAFDRWHSIWGGTVVWVMDGEPVLDAYRGSNMGFNQGVFYHFEIASGRCCMVRTLYFAAIGATVNILSHTIDYKLRAGAWV